MTKTELLEELERRGVRLNEIAAALFADPGFPVAVETSHMRITDTTVGDLGCPRGATFAQVAAVAIARGLSLCPLEVAPHLRLQFMDQPEGCWGHPPSAHRAPAGSLTIASRPLSGDDGFSFGFYLRRIRGEPWLRGYRCDPEHVWSTDDRFIFATSACATQHY